MQIAVFVDNITPRVDYILNHILGEMLGLELIITSNEIDFGAYKGPQIAYSEKKFDTLLRIKPHRLLYQNGIKTQLSTVFPWRNIPAFFQTNPEGIISFDIFAASFFLITRYEEYELTHVDEHGRFDGTKSFAFKNAFIEMPLVDLWVKELGAILKEHYPELTFKSREFEFIPTIDIDNAYAYKHKGLLRSMLGIVKSVLQLNFTEARYRHGVIWGREPDPFDTYEQLYSILQDSPNAIWFFLGGRYGKFDKHVPLSRRAMKRLIREISDKYKVGVHPSYGAGSSRRRVDREVRRLAKILGTNVEVSRQHFLRLMLPYTYRVLASVGIKEDYSMGYSNIVGFRASTCTPFYFFDMLDEKVLPLKIVPFQVMDRALMQGMGLAPNEGVERTVNLAKKVKDVDGTFLTVWHNESLSGINEWSQWTDVFDKIVKGVNNLQ